MGRKRDGEYWAAAPLKREQMVLFVERLDEAIGTDHPVRAVDLILGQVDWTRWEACYHGRLGQPPIHPRVLAGVLLYGLLKRIRSSRRLEEALEERLDFRWLVEGRRIDHSTLSKFRGKHTAELKDLFVQIGLIAQKLNFLRLATLAFDGTRVRANNRRSGTRTLAELEKMQEELAARFAELEAQMAEADAREDALFSAAEADALAEEWADLERREQEVAAALAELERAREAGETTPKRIPLTDPQSRMTPNKEGGYAPNYTPLATVDVDSGLVVSAEVIAMTNEECHLAAAIDDVQQQFGLEKPPAEMLADGLMSTGANLAALEERGVTLYSPTGEPDSSDNPAVRDDPTQPVPPEAWDRLPARRVTVHGQKSSQLATGAFVYDESQDCYWCPQGQRLKHVKTTSETTPGGRVYRCRYYSSEQACAGCPLRERCLQGKAKQRQVSHDQYRDHRRRHARRMATAEAQEKYARRRHAAERPFAMIKHVFGGRRFLLRGLERVRNEWRWMTIAFNLHRLMHMIPIRAGPTPA